jgi:hypothetical protein
MKYIWINPVVADMYQPEDLRHFLKSHGFIQVEVSLDWLEIVRKKYRTLLENTEHTVIDMRCPKAIDFIDAYELRHKVEVPSIEPILLHCAREICQKEELQGTEKIITTPCQALADLGNSLKLAETTFLPWNKFLSSLDDSLEAVLPSESPIPLGFFDTLDCKKISVTEKQNICDLFENFRPNEYDLIELLYCKNGCHNGDGICNYK